MTNYDVIMKLIGPINPVGETNIDNERFENLKAMTELVDQLLDDIDQVSHNNKKRQEASMKKAGKFADNWLDEQKALNE